MPHSRIQTTRTERARAVEVRRSCTSSGLDPRTAIPRSYRRCRSARRTRALAASPDAHDQDEREACPTLTRAPSWRPAARIEVALANRERLLDAQPGAPEHDDQRPQAGAVAIVGSSAHHRDDLLDGRRDRAAPCCGAGDRRGSPARLRAIGADRRHRARYGRSWDLLPIEQQTGPAATGAAPEARDRARFAYVLRSRRFVDQTPDARPERSSETTAERRSQIAHSASDGPRAASFRELTRAEVVPMHCLHPVGPGGLGLSLSRKAGEAGFIAHVSAARQEQGRGQAGQLLPAHARKDGQPKAAGTAESVARPSDR